MATACAGTDRRRGTAGTRRAALTGAAKLIVALIAMLSNAGAASATCETGVTGSLGVSKTFSHCAGEQSYVVPLGVTKVRVVAIGARGGNRFGVGGRGGRAEAIVDVPVSSSTLYVLVGGTGEEGSFNGGGSPPWPRTSAAAVPPT